METRISRHNAIRDVFFSAAQSAALAPSVELPNLIPNSLSKSADIYIPTWSHGRPAAMDVHVISPLQQQTLGEAATTPGHALQVGVQRKLSSHLSHCWSVELEFIPLVIETLGGLAEDSIFHSAQPWKIHCLEDRPPGCPHVLQTVVSSCRHRPLARERWSVVAPPANPSPLSGWFRVV